jgi:putative addiction module component (TIGR02574 family)
MRAWYAAAMGRPAIKIDDLSSEEKLSLIGELWNSLEQTAVSLSDAQRKELHRRLDLLDAQGPTGSSWDEVERRIRSSAQ